MKGTLCVLNTECPAVHIANDDRICLDACPDEYNNYAIENVNYCTKCEGLIPSDKSKCVSTCLPEVRLDNLRTCIPKDICSKKISSDSSECKDSCQVGEYYTSVAGKSYKQCVTCTDETPIPKADNSGCGLCEGSKIADIELHICLDSLSKCEKPKLVFPDLKRCGRSCKEPYIK